MIYIYVPLPVRNIPGWDTVVVGYRSDEEDYMSVNEQLYAEMMRWTE